MAIVAGRLDCNMGGRLDWKKRKGIESERVKPGLQRVLKARSEGGEARETWGNGRWRAAVAAQARLEEGEEADERARAGSD